MTDKSKKKEYVPKLISILVLLCLLVLTGLISYTSVRFIYGRKYNSEQSGTESDDEIVNENLLSAIFLDDPDTSEVDYIAIRDFNTNVNKVNIIMFPTDATVTLTSDRRKELKSMNADVEKTIYLTDIGKHFGSSVEKYEETVKVLEDIFGEEIPSYEAMNFEDFKKIINLLEPIDFEVDTELSYYTDSGEEAILEKGENSIDGERALGIVTFFNKDEVKAEYKEENSTKNTEPDPATTTNNTNKTISTKTASLDENGRIERASEYLKKFTGRAMSQATTRDEMLTFINNYYKLLTANGNVGDLTKYIDNFMDLSEKKISFYTVKGSRSDDCYEINSEKAESALTDMMEEVESETETETEAEKDIEDSKTLNLEVINGAYIQGFAAEWKKKLEKDGYTVQDIGTYGKEAPEDGLIIVTEEGMGEDLKKDYFPDAEIEVGEIESGADIQIILGRNNSDQEDTTEEE